MNDTRSIPEQFESERLVIRAPRIRDAAEVNAAVHESIEELRQWMPWAKVLPSIKETKVNQRKARLEYLAGKDFHFNVFLKGTDTFIIGCGLHRVDWSVPKVEIGYWIRTSFSGQGYVTETVNAITEFAVKQLGAKRVEIRMDDRNERSWRVAERCGFQLEGILRNEARDVNGKLRSTRVYAKVMSEANVRRIAQAQYQTSGNLNARMQLHARFSTNTVSWARWVFDQFDVPTDGRILELGCGSGGLWLANQDRIPGGCRITLTDVSPGMLEQARLDLESAGHTFNHQIVDAQDIPFPDASMDAVIANHMLYHIPDRARAFSEIRRVLKPSGRLYATTNGSDNMQELNDLLNRVGLPVMSSHIITLTLENGSEELSSWFRQVELRRYEDSLSVTEVEPLVNYILSLPNVSPTEEQLDEIRRIAGEEITRDGSYHITKSSGMFIAQLDE